MKKWLLAAWLVVLVGSNAELASAREPAMAKQHPVAMLLHGGGFLFEGEDRMAVASELAGELGFEVSYVDYPLFDLPGAIATAERHARALGRGGRTVLAFGESAGGTLAALLAQRGLVDAAATYSPVADMRAFPAHTEDAEQYMEFIQADRRDLRRASPALFTSSAPILALRAAGDRGFVARGMRRWARRDHAVELVRVPGRHSGARQPAFYARNATLALRWLQQQS